jgi:hypothetical protein
MSAANQLLCAVDGLRVFWFGVTHSYRWEFYEALRSLWGVQVEELFMFPPKKRPCADPSVDEPGEVGRMFQCALPDLYKYRVMTLDSFLAVMDWLDWEKDKHYYCVEQIKNETVFTLPGVEHHVSYSWPDPDLLPDEAERAKGFTLEQVGRALRLFKFNSY